MIRSELDAIDHVLRGALNTALLNLQVLSTTLGPEPPAGPLIERVRAELRRLAERLLPAALDIVALEIKRTEQVDLRQLVVSTLAEHRLDQLVLAPGPSPSVRGDPDLLALALAHLARNAVAATPEKGPAPRIHVDVEPRLAALCVSNACRDAIPRITEGTITGRRGHLGGLVVATRVARLHGGTLGYEAVAGELVARFAIPIG